MFSDTWQGKVFGIPVPVNSVSQWSQEDLIQRVIKCLEIAHQLMTCLHALTSEVVSSETPDDGAGVFFRSKVVAETTMLLLCVHPIRHLDGRIRELTQALAVQLIPLARHKDVQAAICFDPGNANAHSVAHTILSHLGYPNPKIDDLVSSSLELGQNFGPELLPHQRLQRTWLARVRSTSDRSGRTEHRLVADSKLGGTLDILGCTRADLYGFTHAVMYASDFGTRELPKTRSRKAIAQDAEAALTVSLETNDFDLTAELLLTWTMLRLPWSPIASFAFAVLAKVEDKLGFLPGLLFDHAHDQTLVGAERDRYRLSSSYHTVYVMGFLCATALRPNRSPPQDVARTRRRGGSCAALLGLIGHDRSAVCWREPFGLLTPAQQLSLEGFLFTVLIRRAKNIGNLYLIQQALEVVVTYKLAFGPTLVQTLALLRRSQILV